MIPTGRFHFNTENMNVTCQFRERVFVSRDFEGAKPIKNYDKEFSESYSRNSFMSEGSRLT